MEGRLYRYHFRIVLSTTRSLDEEERRHLDALMKELMKKSGFEMKKIAIHRNAASLDFIGDEEQDAEKLVRASEAAFGSGLWSDFKVQKTIVIDGKTLIP
jgi:hypothetical protein